MSRCSAAIEDIRVLAETGLDDLLAGAAAVEAAVASVKAAAIGGWL